MDQKEWDFDSGNLVLDFANTAEFHARADPCDLLETYTDLVAWSVEAGLLSKNEKQALLAIANREPDSASDALAKALEFRELIYHIFSVTAEGGSPDPDELSRFNQILAESLIHTQISHNEQGFEWGWQNTESSLESMLWSLARQAAYLITSEDLYRVGECADDRGCGYLFIDHSRNHSRRWCSMETCGNRAKAQRHYKRKSAK